MLFSFNLSSSDIAGIQRLNPAPTYCLFSLANISLGCVYGPWGLVDGFSGGWAGTFTNSSMESVLFSLTLSAESPTKTLARETSATAAAATPFPAGNVTCAPFSSPSGAELWGPWTENIPTLARNLTFLVVPTTTGKIEDEDDPQ